MIYAVLAAWRGNNSNTGPCRLPCKPLEYASSSRWYSYQTSYAAAREALKRGDASKASWAIASGSNSRGGRLAVLAFLYSEPAG